MPAIFLANTVRAVREMLCGDGHGIIWTPSCIFFFRKKTNFINKKEEVPTALDDLRIFLFKLQNEEQAPPNLLKPNF